MEQRDLAKVADLVDVMAQLRAPGGCPWDAVQTHASLAPHLLEETYEFLHAVDDDDIAEMRAELGDVLLQVVMHSVIASEKEGGFSLGDVAEGLRLKMIARHPHVFGDDKALTAEQVFDRWETSKQKATGRASILEGIPPTLPALSRASVTLRKLRHSSQWPYDEHDNSPQSVASRELERLVESTKDGSTPTPSGEASSFSDDTATAAGDMEERYVTLLLAVSEMARRDHIDLEHLLRRHLIEWADKVAQDS